MLWVLFARRCARDLQEAGDEARAGGADRVTESERATVGVDARGIQPEVLRKGEALGGEAFVDLEKHGERVSVARSPCNTLQRVKTTLRCTGTAKI